MQVNNTKLTTRLRSIRHLLWCISSFVAASQRQSADCYASLDSPCFDHLLRSRFRWVACVALALHDSHLRRERLYECPSLSGLRHEPPRRVSTTSLGKELGLTEFHSDDIVCTSLNPSQSFKSTILAGMHPHTINDIAGRALGFWTYQVTQEAAFQQMILTDAQEVSDTFFAVCRVCLLIVVSQRASVMEKRLDTLLREANSELAGLREKIQGKLVTNEGLGVKSHVRAAIQACKQSSLGP